MFAIQITKMARKEKSTYVGELIRKEIKNQKVKNGFVIKYLRDAGFDMPDARFSNKLYGERDQFTPEEIIVCSKALNKDFPIENQSV